MTELSTHDVGLPVVLFDRDWVLYPFETLADAEAWVEQIDIEDCEYAGFAADGRRIAFALESERGDAAGMGRPTRIRAYFTADYVDPATVLRLVTAALPAASAARGGVVNALRKAVALFGHVPLQVPDEVVQAAVDVVRPDDVRPDDDRAG